MTDTLLISDAINVIRPGAEYTIRGDSVEWQDETQTEPTVEEINASISDAKWNRVRSKRDVLLSSCDWSSVADNQLSDADRTAWETYRQTLRDIPQTQSDPDNVTWPTPPTT
jgi:hypothetical protein